MRALSEEVEALLAGVGQDSARRGGLLASELIAQVTGRAPSTDGQSAGLTIELKPDAVRLKATGPVVPPTRATAEADGISDPLADRGQFLLDRVADRWGVDDGGRPGIWAEIEAPG